MVLRQVTYTRAGVLPLHEDSRDGATTGALVRVEELTVCLQ